VRRDELDSKYEWLGWFCLITLLICYAVAVYDGCSVRAQFNSEVHMRSITKYNSVSDQLIDEIDSLEGMWKRYATAQRIFARAHNREVQTVETTEQDPGRLQRLGDTAIKANEELVLLMLDIVEQLKEQASLTSRLAREVDRLPKPNLEPDVIIN
jgi:hypothetical protein